MSVLVITVFQAVLTYVRVRGYRRGLNRSCVESTHGSSVEGVPIGDVLSRLIVFTSVIITPVSRGSIENAFYVLFLIGTKAYVVIIVSTEGTLAVGVQGGSAIAIRTRVPVSIGIVPRSGVPRLVKLRVRERPILIGSTDVLLTLGGITAPLEGILLLIIEGIRDGPL